MRLFVRAYGIGNSLWHVHKLFSAYSHRSWKIVYETSLLLIFIHIDFIISFVIEIAYT